MRIGTYIMKMFNYTDQFVTHRVQVEIIGESAKSYFVRLLERGPAGQPIGTTYRPRKHNVINIADARQRFVPDLRLPYKD